MSNFGDLAIWRSGVLELGGLAIWRFGDLAIWRFGGLAIWRLLVVVFGLVILELFTQFTMRHAVYVGVLLGTGHRDYGWSSCLQICPWMLLGGRQACTGGCQARTVKVGVDGSRVVRDGGWRQLGGCTVKVGVDGSRVVRDGGWRQLGGCTVEVGVGGSRVVRDGGWRQLGVCIVEVGI